MTTLDTAMEDLFCCSRNSNLSVWLSAYPTAQLVDDCSVSRSLGVFNECNKFKYHLALFHNSKEKVNATTLVEQLDSIGKVFSPSPY